MDKTDDAVEQQAMKVGLGLVKKMNKQIKYFYLSWKKRLLLQTIESVAVIILSR